MHFPFEGAIRVFWVKAYLTVVWVCFCFCFSLVLFLSETDLRNTFEAYSKDAFFIITCQNKES